MVMRMSFKCIPKNGSETMTLQLSLSPVKGLVFQEDL